MDDAEDCENLKEERSFETCTFFKSINEISDGFFDEK